MARNNVSVTLSGRDQLSGVLNNANKNIQSVARAGKLLAGIGLANALLGMSSAAKRLARDMGGELQQEIRRTENLMNATVQTMIESTIGTDGMSRANDFLAEQVLPRVITAFEMTRDAIMAVIRFIAEKIRMLNELRQRALDTIGRIVPGFNRLRDAVGENIEKFVEWSEAQVATRREALQTTLRLNEQREAADKLKDRVVDIIAVYGRLTDNLNMLTQEQVAQIRIALDAERERLEQIIRTSGLTEELADAIDRLNKVQEQYNRTATPAVLEAFGGEVESTQTKISKLSGATQHLAGLNSVYLDELQAGLIVQQASAQFLLDNAKNAIEAAEANALLLETERALRVIRDERIERAKPVLDPILEQWQEALRELAVDIDLAVTDIIGNTVFDAFAGIFEMDFSSNIRQFGANILRGMGSIFAQMGQAMIAASPIFKGIGAAMTNPFTAGPASLKFGLALVALGGALGGIATRVGGAGPGGMSAPPSARLQVTGLGRQEFGGEARLVIQGGLLDMSDPRQATALGRAIGELSGRRVILQGA